MWFDRPMDAVTAITVIATVLGALLAGLYVAFAIAVMPGLARTTDATFTTTMTAVNTAIVNPPFLVLFLGAPVGAVLAAVFRDTGRPWLVAGAVLAVIATWMTVLVNVPLNNRLDADHDAGDPEGRRRFEGAWVRANAGRTVLHTASATCLVIALTR